MKQEKAKWVVSLNNGATYYEDKGDYAVIAGELSPWQRLVAFLRENPEIKITSLSLYTDSGKRFNLPSAGKNPKFKAFGDAKPPAGYKFFRKAGLDMGSDGKPVKTETYGVIEAQYEDGKRLQVWVSDENVDNSWCLLI